MERSGFMLWRVGLLVLTLLEGSSATLSPSGIDYEVVALMAIKNALNDRYNVLENWDINSVDPCYWRMFTCSADGYVSVLGLPSQSLTGTLSPSIANLSNLQSVIIGNPLICGPNSDNNCSVVYPEPVSFPPDGVKDGSESGTKSHRVAVTFGVSFGAAFLIIVIIGSFVWWRYRHNQQIFFDVNG